MQVFRKDHDIIVQRKPDLIASGQTDQHSTARLVRRLTRETWCCCLSVCSWVFPEKFPSNNFLEVNTWEQIGQLR